MKICIGLLSNRGFEQQMVLSLLNMIKAYDYGCEFHFEVATEGYTIAENRNSLAAKACQNNCTHILMIDDDMMFPRDLLIRLLKHDKEIVGVNYHPRMLCTLYMVGLFGEEGRNTKEEDLPKELFKCRGIGFGAVLIKTKLFHELERPWFDWEIFETGMIKEGEDFYFCTKARKAGYDIWCDPTIKMGHIGKYTY